MTYYVMGYRYVAPAGLWLEVVHALRGTNRLFQYRPHLSLKTEGKEQV
jgi:hypothetical protein